MNVKITLQEKVTYTNEIIVKLPEFMSDEEFEEIIGKVEMECRSNSAKEVASILKNRYGIEIMELSSNFPENPDFSLIEITDIEDQ